MEFTGEFYVPEQHGNLELEHVHRYLQATQIVAGKSVLDIACGEGYGSLLLAASATTVTGVDISEEVIAHARERYARDNLTFLVGDCSKMPVTDHSVDVVVSFETIEHHDQHEAMMREIKRVLRPDGCLMMSTPDRLHYSIEPDTSNPFHVKELLEDEFKSLIRSHFRKAAFFGQRIAYGSTMFSDEGAQPSRCYWKDARSGEIFSGNNRPLYWIALASDTDLPEVAVGLFEQPIDEADTVNAWRAATVSAQQAVAGAQQAVASAQQAEAAARTQADELRAIVARSRAAARRAQGKLAGLAEEIAAQRQQLDQLTATVAQRGATIAAQGETVASQEEELVLLRPVAEELRALRSSRLISLRDAVKQGPLSLRKIARVGKRSLALVFPRVGRQRPPRATPSAPSPEQVPGFDPAFYLKAYPDVAAAGCDPLEHYLQFGRSEGRLPRAPRAPTDDEQLPEFDVPAQARDYLPLVSIIVPAYNHAEFLEDRLTSIYSQTYSGPVEVLLLDDASADRSLEILRKFAERYPARTTVVANLENSGSAFRQWRKGLALARGEVVWIAESDDLCDLGFLDTLVPLMANPAIMLAFAKTLFFRETTDKVVFTLEEYLHDLVDLRFDVEWVRSAKDLVLAGFYDRNLIPNVSGALLRHPGEMPFLDDEAWQAMQLAGDWLFYLELIKGGLVAFSPETTDYHRSSEATLTSQVGKTSRLAVEIEQVRTAATQICGLSAVPPRFRTGTPSRFAGRS